MHYTKTLLRLSNGTRLTLPTGEGAPSKSEGVGGVFVGGLGKSSPVGLGNAQGLGGVCRGLAPSRFCGAFTPHQAVFGYQIRSLLIRLVFSIMGVR
ncbi:hypothetical protein CDB3_31700 [Bacillus sp. CDB3]|nr:hypothetical protein CDB3_31700 [Bacillus sp. CDB3]